MIVIRDTSNKDLRYVSIKGGGEGTTPIVIHLSSDKDMSLLAVKVPGDIDLVSKMLITEKS